MGLLRHRLCLALKPPPDLVPVPNPLAKNPFPALPKNTGQNVICFTNYPIDPL